MKNFIISERASLFEPNIYISMIVKFSGNIKKSQIIGAVNAAYHSNESTMSKIVLTNTGEAYYEKQDHSECRIFIREDNNIEKIIKESEKVPFEIDKGELIRTYIIPKENTITMLVVAHHLVGDGQSILIFINDIIKHLAVISLEYKPIHIISKNTLNKNFKLPWYIRLFINLKNTKWNKIKKVFTFDDYYNIHEKYWKVHSSNIHIKTYNEQELKNIIDESKKYNVTLNSYLIALLQKNHDNLNVIGIPVSIRDNNTSMSNQTSGIKIKYKYNKQKTIGENAKVIHEKIYKCLNNTITKYFPLTFMSLLSPSLTDAVLMETHMCYHNDFVKKMCSIMGYEGKTKTQLGVTNLTRINIPSTYKNFKVEDILFIPPKVSYSDIVVGISTFNDKLIIIISD